MRERRGDYWRAASNALIVLGMVVGVVYLVWMAAWAVRAWGASDSAAHRPPHYQLWMCVHKNERSAWNDPNAPYYGGLQMGSWFMRTYAPRLLRVKGTADRWTPLEQMWVAENAYKRERYSTAWFNGQWPPSAGRCGL